MLLLAQQVMLGRCLQAAAVDATLAESAHEFAIDDTEIAALQVLVDCDGFRFTRHVRRSWCIGRTAGATQLTLSLLPIAGRRQIVEAWVDAGGGAALDVTSEAAKFLEFVAQRLVDPSHELSVCRMEQAAYRASAAATSFTPPDPAYLDAVGARFRRGTGGAVIRFCCEPRRLFATITAKEPLPPLGDASFPYLFAPGLPTLRRAASQAEASVWDRLAVHTSVATLRREGFSPEVILQLFTIGAIETA